jgi:hypothetical protein
MDEKQQKQVNEAAEKFAEAIKESYQALADRSVSAQELNAQLTQEFFNGVINNLRTQAENNRALAEDLIEQQRKQQEASQALTQESVNAYMDFLGTVFAYPPQGTQTPAREAATELGDESGGEGAAAGTDAVRHPLSSWVDNSSDTPVAPLGSDEQAPREAPPPDEESPPTVAWEESPPGKQTP